MAIVLCGCGSSAVGEAGGVGAEARFDAGGMVDRGAPVRLTGVFDGDGGLRTTLGARDTVAGQGPA